jgi:hypothetical protein
VITADDIHAVFRDHFPAQAAMTSIEYVQTTPRADGSFGVVMRLIVYEAVDDKRQIRDIKEQEIHLNPGDSSRERLEAFTRAFVPLLEQALARVADFVETYMPHDLLLWDVFKLKKAQTEDDFRKALLVRSRLGKYVLPPAE